MAEGCLVIDCESLTDSQLTQGDPVLMNELCSLREGHWMSDYVSYSS